MGQLAGAILCNEGQDTAAAGCLTFATAAAREAGDYDAWACTLIWHAYIPLFDARLFDARPDQALPLLQIAAGLARRGDSALPTRYAVAAYSAVAYAGVGELAARARVLVRGSDMVFNVNFVSVRQALTPDRLQGQVSATVRALTYGVVPVGALVGGQLGATIGLRGTVLVGAAGVLLAFLWVLLSPVRALRAMPAAVGRSVADRR